MTEKENEFEEIFDWQCRSMDVAIKNSYGKLNLTWAKGTSVFLILPDGEYVEIFLCRCGKKSADVLFTAPRKILIRREAIIHKEEFKNASQLPGCVATAVCRS
jgi:hypothetical protein